MIAAHKSGQVSLLLISLLTPHALGEEKWSLQSQEEWSGGLETHSGVNMEAGKISLRTEVGYLLSNMKTFDQKMSAESLVIDQSALWENWEPTANIGPSNLGDAPVLLSLGPDNYWMFGRYGGARPKKGKTAEPFVAEEATLEGFDIPLQTTPFKNQFNAPGGLKKGKGGYHAWQSKDMVNWVHHGSITEKFSAWMTTAEYADGKFYFYYDYPNDQDPHVYVDEDVTDGEPGENMGMAFQDPSDGSDCAFIRDLDGKFHVIYEDWSPVSANKRSWDSPLAGHAVSADGLKDFAILEPAVDERTVATGEMKTYKHPHWLQHPDWDTNIGEYEVHMPEQEAFGDWAAIGIGSRYYLFGDYDHVGTHKMSVGIFTSTGLDKQFEFCNEVGTGHPDPDICFAEGQFYLATQQKADFVSPGPWVETVQVRVGVDTDNDAKIDQWTDWQEVKEKYDYTPGFAKQIQKEAAKLDLSDLPAGYGFQFEVKLADSTANESSPILDALEMTFVPAE